jgi:hypothetical protein
VVDTFAVRKPKYGPEEEHYASSAESEHEDQDMQPGEPEQVDPDEDGAVAPEEAYLNPDELEASREDVGNWSDQEIPDKYRKEVLAEVPAHIRREVRKAHNGLGHPAKTTFLRMMKLGNATDVAIKYAKTWECPVCARKVAPRKPQVAAGEIRPYGFNKIVCIDLKYLKTTDRKRCVALSIIDAGTGMHAATLLKTRRTDHVARKFFIT